MKKTFPVLLLFLISVLFSFSLAFAQEVTTTKTVKEFFKANTKLWVAKKAAENYKASLNKISLKVIQKASELAKADNRKTVLERDIEQATEETFRRAPMSTKELMEKIKLLSIIELTDLNKKIKAYGEELLESAKEKN